MLNNVLRHAEVAAYNIAEVLSCQAEVRCLIERYFCLPLVQATIWGGALAAQHGAVSRCKPGHSLISAAALTLWCLFFQLLSHRYL